MAESKPDTKVTRVDVKPVGVFTSWVSHSTDLAERTTSTIFAIARDVRGEVNQRILGVLGLIESTQLGALKLARTIDDRLDKLAEETIDTAESFTLSLIRVVRDTGSGVTQVVAKAA